MTPISDKEVEAAAQAIDALVWDKAALGLSPGSDEQARVALEAASRVRPEVVGVAVRQLDWREVFSPRLDGPPESTGDWDADSSFGTYSVIFDTDNDMASTPWCCWTSLESLGHFATLDEAKAAAQADFNARIRSALVSPPDAGVDRAGIEAEVIKRCAKVAHDHFVLWANATNIADLAIAALGASDIERAIRALAKGKGETE